MSNQRSVELATPESGYKIDTAIEGAYGLIRTWTAINAGAHDDNSAKNAVMLTRREFLSQLPQDAEKLDASACARLTQPVP